MDKFKITVSMVISTIVVIGVLAYVLIFIGAYIGAIIKAPQCIFSKDPMMCAALVNSERN